MRHSAKSKDHGKGQRLAPPPVNDATTVRDTERTATVPPEMMQQAMQRLFTAYQQRVARVSQTDERLEQFRTNIRRDALEMSLTMQRSCQDLQHQQHAIEQIKSTLFEDVQDRVKSLEERLRSVMDQEMHVHQTIDRNTHRASIKALISEQEDVRKLVKELANRWIGHMRLAAQRRVRLVPMFFWK